ncbi:hypothetical protein [Mycobacterium sp. SMC-4]|uniref:hypothetical protein n=1 Tax=Mycobacterium sp. SMC-4 TaxID=2857059 RepID=UPI0021B4914A|nr:hypothetical protein [Mycobacterium sp. SMC-4]UXA18104.1 hypothetical protein KXD98_26180 [Mycobacterium sp. SMC-4]
MAFDVGIAVVEITTDTHRPSTWWALEFGGRNPTEGVAGGHVYIDNVTYTSERDAGHSNIAYQGGTYAPVGWYINAAWWHAGESMPQWRSEVYGDTSPLVPGV